jgi:purine-cytosine permease-like protein
MRSRRWLSLSMMLCAATMVAWGAVAPWTTAVPDIDNPSERRWLFASALILIVVSVVVAVTRRFLSLQTAAVVQLCAAVALAWSDTSAKTGSFQDAPSPGQRWGMRLLIAGAAVSLSGLALQRTRPAHTKAPR